MRERTTKDKAKAREKVKQTKKRANDQWLVRAR